MKASLDEQAAGSDMDCRGAPRRKASEDSRSLQARLFHRSEAFFLFPRDQLSRVILSCTKQPGIAMSGCFCMCMLFVAQTEGGAVRSGQGLLRGV